MLSLLTQQRGGVPPHALPALAAYLTEKGLMPRWVQVGVLLSPQCLLLHRIG